MPDPASSDDLAAGILVPARITLFGFDVVPANARIEARSVGWEGAARLDSTGRWD